MKKLIIIGAGLAGLSATITACENEIKVANDLNNESTKNNEYKEYKEYNEDNEYNENSKNSKNIEIILVSTMPSERAQSVMAEGGINGALNTKGENDSVTQHCEDTLKAGLYLANPNAVKSLTDNAPDIIQNLDKYGVIFNRDSNGNIDLRNFGGQKKKRTAFAKSSSGKQIMTAMIQNVRKYEDMGLVKRYNSHSFLELIKLKDNLNNLNNIDNIEICRGCLVINNYTNEIIPILADGVIIASGGLHGLFNNITGSLDNTGIVTANLFTSGVLIANGEFIQYHPTTLKFHKKHLLISEAARGEGGRLFVYKNGEKYYFMEDKYPELGNLMPRDVVSYEIWNILNNGNYDDNIVYLDLTELPDEVLKNKLLDIVEDCKTFFNIDPKFEPIHVIPGIHYFMGGIKVDQYHRTNINGLYAAGECACQYHGANRLGGNSLLGAIFGGKIAAETFIKDNNNNNNNNNNKNNSNSNNNNNINNINNNPNPNPNSNSNINSNYNFNNNNNSNFNSNFNPNSNSNNSNSNNNNNINNNINNDNQKNKNKNDEKLISQNILAQFNEKIAILKEKDNNYSLSLLKKEMGNILEKCLGIVRNEEMLKNGLENINDLIKKADNNYDSANGVYENFQFNNQCLLSKALIKSALSRKETRGSHNRKDYPKTLDNYKKTTVAKYIGFSNNNIVSDNKNNAKKSDIYNGNDIGGIDIYFEDIPELKNEK
ncbi:MAG: FAD-binding protein [Methanobrevibacter sp.]|jgi:succinate dehydrogenase / fumarate reductase flavoprotein subunit|nr:FAD-binding protein [Candidatus Methanoflexus mossambicus]